MGSAQKGRAWGWRRVSCTGCGRAWPCPATALLTVAGRLGRPVGSRVLEPEVPDGVPALGSGLRDGGTNLQVLLYERTPRCLGCAVASMGEEEPAGMAAPSVLHGCPWPLPCSSGPGSSDPSAPAAQLLPLALGGTLTFVPVGWSQRHSLPSPPEPGSFLESTTIALPSAFRKVCAVPWGLASSCPSAPRCSFLLRVGPCPSCPR